MTGQLKPVLQIYELVKRAAGVGDEVTLHLQPVGPGEREARLVHFLHLHEEGRVPGRHRCRANQSSQELWMEIEV